MQIRFGAQYCNNLSVHEKDRGVSEEVSSWFKSDPAIGILMDPKMTPDLTLTLERSRDARFCIAQTQAKGTRAPLDLGETLGKIRARKQILKSNILNRLIMHHEISDNPHSLQALVQAAKKLPKALVQAALAGGLKSIARPRLTQYKISLQDLPLLRMKNKPTITPPDLAGLSQEDEKTVSAAYTRVVKLVQTDPALLFALQKSVSPGVQLSIKMAQPGDVYYKEISDSDPTEDAVANMELVLTFANGDEETISLGNNLKAFGSRQSTLRRTMLEWIAKRVENPDKILNRLDRFSQKYHEAISQLYLVHDTFNALSRAHQDVS